MSSALPDGSEALGVLPVLSAHRVVKTFGSTTALAGVDLSVSAGEIVGLVGANGAGKSTLIALLSGALRPDSGELMLGDEPTVFSSPAAASASGIVTVQQDVDLALVPELSVAENLVLDALAAGELGEFPSRQRIRAAAQRVVGDTLDVPLDRPVSSLRTSQKQQIVIERALHRGARVLILDEPTAALSVSEQHALHERLLTLAAQGTAIIYVTHHLGELAAICTRVVALREGRIAGSFPRPFETGEIVTAMLGELVTRVTTPARTSDSAEPALELDGVRAFRDSTPLNIVVEAGEVLGITGLLGAGKTELLHQIVGAAPLVDGRMCLHGRDLRPRHPSEAIARGIGFVPEDRRTAAEFPEWTIAANITLPSLKRHSRLGLLRPAAERQTATTAIERLRIVCSGAWAGIRSLSGGNRQKVVVSRWLAAQSRLLVLDEPFRGVDLGVRADLAALLRSGGVEAAIVATSDAEEILEVADRILVLSEGRIVAELTPQSTDVDRLTALMMNPAPHPTETP